MQKVISWTKWKKVFIWFNENLHAFCNNNCNLNFAKHPLKNVRFIGAINNAMEIQYTTNKCLHLNAIEKYYVYEETKKLTKIITKIY